MKRLLTLIIALIMLCSFASAISEETAWPMDTDETLTMWLKGLSTNASYASYNDLPFFQFMEEATGVHVEFSAPVTGADQEQAFNLLISSGELPDIIYMNDLPKRAESLLEEGYIIALNDYMQYAPNLSAILAADELEDKSIKTDAGQYYAFPFIRERTHGTYVGLSVNTQLLEEVGMEAPVTIADWDEYLYAIKDKCDVPLGGNSLARLRFAFSNAFGFDGTMDYYVEVGVVKTWIDADGYKDMMELFARWMNDGILDPDIITINTSTFYNKMAAQTYGAIFQGSGSIQGYIDQVTARDGGFFWDAVPYPVMNEGDEIKFIQGESCWKGVGAMITTSCKNIELAMRWLDFNYSEEGINLWNYGKEGYSYTMVDGKPQYTALITEANESLRDAAGRYCGMIGDGWSVQAFYNLLTTGLADEYNQLWDTTAPNAIEYRMPAISATPEELEELSDIESALMTYANTMFTSFLIGSESLDNFDEYLANLEELKISRVLEIKQAQYDRFMSR